MTTHTPLDDLLAHLQHPAARDLAWALLSPPLLAAPPCPQRHPLADSRWGREPGQLIDWLRDQDHAPQALHGWLAQHNSRRLGLYYERLWQFALQAAPDVEVLAANLPIRQDGQTLGELDLLLRDARGVHHLELAVKFYLGEPPPQGTGAARWIGPGSHDRLDLKLAHLHRHQLPLSRHATARAELQRLTDQPIDAAMWLGGYLFYPCCGHCLPAPGVDPRHRRGRWLRRCDWPAWQAGAPSARWQPLPRHAWLAPARLAPSEVWCAERWQTWLASLPDDSGAQLLVRLQPGADGTWLEQERLFLVADHWPEPDIKVC